MTAVSAAGDSGKDTVAEGAAAAKNAVSSGAAAAKDAASEAASKAGECFLAAVSEVFACCLTDFGLRHALYGGDHGGELPYTWRIYGVRTLSKGV